MGYMIVAVTNDKEHLYIYHGKDKQGVPIFYGFKNGKNTKVYPRVFSSFQQATDVADGVAEYLTDTRYKSLTIAVWDEDDVNEYLANKF